MEMCSLQRIFGTKLKVIYFKYLKQKSAYLRSYELTFAQVYLMRKMQLCTF